MATTTRTRRRYDHRLRLLVHQTGDVELAIQNGVPRSTARDWSRRSTPDVVSLDVLSMSEEALQQEVVATAQRRVLERGAFDRPRRSNRSAQITGKPPPAERGVAKVFGPGTHIPQAAREVLQAVRDARA